jgi:hypothetical protein
VSINELQMSTSSLSDAMFTVYFAVGLRTGSRQKKEENAHKCRHRTQRQQKHKFVVNQHRINNLLSRSKHTHTHTQKRNATTLHNNNPYVEKVSVVCTCTATRPDFFFDCCLCSLHNADC